MYPHSALELKLQLLEPPAREALSQHENTHKSPQKLLLGAGLDDLHHPFEALLRTFRRGGEVAANRKALVEPAELAGSGILKSSLCSFTLSPTHLCTGHIFVAWKELSGSGSKVALWGVGFAGLASSWRCSCNSLDASAVATVPILYLLLRLPQVLAEAIYLTCCQWNCEATACSHPGCRP